MALPEAGYLSNPSRTHGEMRQALEDLRNAVATLAPVTPEGALIVANRLSEFDNPTAKTQARANLELEDIDCGTFN